MPSVPLLFGNMMMAHWKQIRLLWQKFHNDSEAQCSILRPLLKGIIIFKLMLFDLLLANYRSRRPCPIAPFFDNAGVEADPNKVGTPRSFSEIPIYS